MRRTLSKRQKFGLIIILILGLGSLITFALLFWLVKTETQLGGVVTNGHECAKIGGDILRKGGSAADAAVAAMFCEGVAMPQSCGLGGGFAMTMYQKSTGKVISLIARERAPIGATEDMFAENETLSTVGGLAIAVPGELRGYWTLHNRFGKLTWSELVQPTIDLCRTGILVTPFFVDFFANNEGVLRSDSSLSEIFINQETNEPYKLGDRIKRPALAAFLEDVAKDGPDVLYNGKYTKGFVEEIQAFGGIITEKDLNLYQPIWREPNVGYLPNGHKVYSAPLPASGILITFITNILNLFIDSSLPNSVTNWQRIVESFKFAYAKRTELGDPDHVDNLSELLANLTSVEYAEHIRSKIFDNETFQDPEYYGANTTSVEDHGTANICVIAPNGDAIALTSTINLYFGSKRRSRSTGIILNDEMDDFSSPNKTNYFGIPPSPSNYILPGKIPMSSMTPTIVVDANNNTRMVVGGAGGSKITTSTALIIIQHLLFNKTIGDAISAPRLHHQLFPMNLTAERHFDKEILAGLGKIGHTIELNEDKGFSALTAMVVEDGRVSGSADYRRSGSVDIL